MAQKQLNATCSHGTVPSKYTSFDLVISSMLRCKRFKPRRSVLINHLGIQQLLCSSGSGFIDSLLSALVCPVTVLMTLLASCICCRSTGSRRTHLQLKNRAGNVCTKGLVLTRYALTRLLPCMCELPLPRMLIVNERDRQRYQTAGKCTRSTFNRAQQAAI